MAPSSSTWRSPEASAIILSGGGRCRQPCFASPPQRLVRPGWWAGLSGSSSQQSAASGHLVHRRAGRGKGSRVGDGHDAQQFFPTRLRPPSAIVYSVGWGLRSLMALVLGAANARSSTCNNHVHARESAGQCSLYLTRSPSAKHDPSSDWAAVSTRCWDELPTCQGGPWIIIWIFNNYIHDQVLTHKRQMIVQLWCPNQLDTWPASRAVVPTVNKWFKDLPD